MAASRRTGEAFPAASPAQREQPTLPALTDEDHDWQGRRAAGRLGQQALLPLAGESREHVNRTYDRMCSGKRPREEESEEDDGEEEDEEDEEGDADGSGGGFTGLKQEPHDPWQQLLQQQQQRQQQQALSDAVAAYAEAQQQQQQLHHHPQQQQQQLNHQEGGPGGAGTAADPAVVVITTGLPVDPGSAAAQESLDRAMMEHHQQLQQHLLQQHQHHHSVVSGGPNGELPLLPLVLPGSGMDQGGQQAAGSNGLAMTPAAAAEAAAAEATAAAAAASHDAMSLSMGISWLAAQQQSIAVAAAESEAARRGAPASTPGAGAGNAAQQRGGNTAAQLKSEAAAMAAAAAAAAEAGQITAADIAAAADAATAAAMAGGADADTAAAMSASIAALMADPAAAAAAAAAMSDPNNPVNMQALAHLAQFQSMGQLPPGTSADVLNSSFCPSNFSALVAAAVSMAQSEGNSSGLPHGMMGLQDTAALISGAQAAGLSGMGLPQDLQDMQAMMQGQAKARGRPRKSGTTDSAGAPISGPPTGNWMRRFHELAYLADKMSLDAAKMSSATITVQVQWSNMPEELQGKLSTASAPVEVPNTATVSYLKRAIGRTLGGHLFPTLLRNHATREIITDATEDRSLMSLGITHNSYVLMETDYHPIPNFGVTPANSLQRLAQGVGTPGAYSMPGSSSRVGTKERFTLTEMYSLVEGMEQHGLKWAKIHKEFKDLENKTQGDLKDKWRNWQRNVANGWSTARVYMPDELKQRIEKLVNEYNLQVAAAGGEAAMGAAGGRLLQAPMPLEGDSNGHAAAAAAAAAMAAGMHMHGLDPSQVVGMDAATAAAIAAHHQQQQHQQHHHNMHHYNAAAMAAALAGVDPATGQPIIDVGGSAGGSGGTDALTAAAEQLLSDPNGQQQQQQQHHHGHQHQQSDPSASIAYHYDPNQGM